METVQTNAETVNNNTAAPAKKLEQKEAVYTYTSEVLASLNLALDERIKRVLHTRTKDLADDADKKLAKEIKKAVRPKLYAAIKSGIVVLKDQKSEADLKKYCSGLVNNWYRKDPRYK